MLPIIRRERILQFLNFEKEIKVSDLSQRLKVAEETIRRDLQEMEKAGRLKRVHGGAIKNARARALDLTIDERESLNSDEKDAIAREAVNLIQDGETIFLDASTTVLPMARYLREKRYLNVLTNSVRIVMELRNAPEINIVCTGGTLRRVGLSLVGPVAESAIRGFHADKLFMSSTGVTIEGGMLDFNELVAKVKKVMIDSSKEKICLADSSKFGTASFAKVSDLESLDYIITDWKISDGVKSQLASFKAKLIIARMP